jgi:hypothetical protein
MKSREKTQKRRDKLLCAHSSGQRFLAAKYFSFLFVSFCGSSAIP